MKHYLNKILVVEGKEDASYLSSFIDTEIVTTNGYDLPKAEIEYINEASRYKEILVLVDPDLAGRKIEKRLKEKLKKATYLNVEISKCNRGKKDGIAECDKEEILRVLEPYFEDENTKKTPLLQGNLIKMAISDSGFRAFLSKKYCLGKCNSKTVLRRLETLQIKEEDLDETMKEYETWKFLALTSMQ